MKLWLWRYKRSLLLCGALVLLLAGVPLAQLITGGTSGSGGGLASVASTVGIQGNGLAGSPIALITPIGLSLGGSGLGTALTYYSNVQSNSGKSISTTANKYDILSPIYIPGPNGITFTHICVYISTSDAVGTYDWGLYSLAGNFIADVGAQHEAVTANNLNCPVINQNASCTGAGAPSSCCTGAGTGTCPASVTLTSGYYQFVGTGTSPTAGIYMAAANNTVPFAMASSSLSQGSTTNGVLPTTVAAAAVSPSILGASNYQPSLILY